MRRRAWPAAVLVALLALPCRAHDPGTPPLWIDAEIQKDGLRYDLFGRLDLLAPWLGLGAGAPFPEAAPERAATAAAVAREFESRNPVRLDGRQVPPTAVDAIVPEEYADDDGPTFVRVRMHYPSSGLPRRVSIEWQDFDLLETELRADVPVLLKYGTRVATPTLTFAEPEITWHAKTARRRVVIDTASLETEPRGRVAVPVWSIVCVVLGLGAGSVQFARRRRGAAGVALLSSLAAAAALWQVGRVTIDDPFAERVGLPGPTQARQLFETLHSNVYKAFDASTEDEIYDLLAVSVAPGLLDELYGDIYESLVLRERGGAFAQVERVEHVSDDILLPEAPEGDGVPEFKVRWEWRVHCQMEHWSHRHRRRNEYEAIYTVRHDATGWKLADVEVLKHERVDLADEEVRPEEAPAGGAAPANDDDATDDDDEPDREGEPQ